MISVINSGRRPVTIEKVAGITRDKKEKNFILTDSLGARELTEGKSTDYLVEQDLIGDLSKIKYFVAYDLTGGEHRIKVKI